MNTHHQKFIIAYIRLGDKKAAYREAYPKAKENTITNSVNRLLARPDIKQEIDAHHSSIRKQVADEVAAQYRAELIDTYEAQATLSKIIRGQLTREKWVKENGHWTTIQVKPSISETLRALNTFFRNNRHEGMKGMNGMKKGQNKEAPLLSLAVESAGLGGNTQHGQPQLQPEPPKNNVHPFGNIYPPNYPGPYYDPDDPNTKEKLQNLRLDRLTDCPDNNNTRPADCGKTQHTSPAELRENTESSPPVLRRGGPQDRGGDTQHGQNNNKSQQNVIPPNGSKNHFAARQRAWRLKLEELRKEGWEHVNELFSEEYNTYAFNQNNQTWKMLKQFEKARDTRALPAEEREKIAQETGWERHPDYPNIMRKRKKVN